jgi:hypothetical protein
MKRSTILIALLALMSSTVYANGANNNCNGNNSCPSNTTTSINNTPQATALGLGVASSSSVATGGTGVGVGIGGNVSNSGNSNASSSSVSNGGSVKNTGINLQGQDQNQSTSNANNSSNSVVVQGDNFEARRNPVSTAYANAPLPSATCRSGAALGVQVMGLGISGGGDKAVDTCEINEATRIAHAIGQERMAIEIFCQNKWAAKSTECQAIAVE